MVPLAVNSSKKRHNGSEHADGGKRPQHDLEAAMSVAA